MSKIEKIATAVFALTFFAVIGMAGSDAAVADIGRFITGMLICIPIMGIAVAVIAHEEGKE